MSDPDDGKGADPPRPKHSVGLPSFLVDEPIGLGDVIKRATTAIGVRPCGSCAQRAERLNEWLGFRPTDRSRESS